jgi:heterodisulfide reductase subunit C
MPLQNELGREEKTPTADLSKAIQTLMNANGLNLCVECGKCSSICPMVKLYGEYVHDRGTRSIVERLCFDPDRIDDEALWYCWACTECTFYCPSGVDFQSFISSFRQLLASHGYTEYACFCKVCGTYMMPKRQLRYLEATLDGNGSVELLYECSNCKKDKYLSALHKLAGGEKASGH